MRLRAVLSGGLLLLAALGVGGCGERRPADTGAASEPAAEVLLLAAHLRANDLNAFVHAAVPPELQSPLQDAWRDNRSRWPLDEVPLGERVPAMLQALAAPQAERDLRRGFDRQFANANGEIRSAAAGLGLFGVKYIQSDMRLSTEERAHYVQLIDALSDWAKTAKLGDPQRARRSIAQLTTAAKRSGLRHPDDFSRYGMDDSLRRLEPVFAGLKTTLEQYGLDLDHSLEELTATLESQEGDRARVRMRYPLGERTIDTVVALERVGKRWYLRDYLRHARAAAAAEHGEGTPLRASEGVPGPATPPAAPPGVQPATQPEARPETQTAAPSSS